MTGANVLLMAILLGAVQQILCKSAKYSMFDPTKEMAYIPIDPELKTKGKAAVDVAVYSFAKAMGGYITAFLLVVTQAADLMYVAPYMALIVIVCAVAWIGAVKKLSGMYARYTAQPS